MVMAPITTQYGGEGGHVTKRMKDFYEARARGGAALLIVEASYVDPRAQTCANQLGISNDEFIPGISELVEVIHRHGAKAALQLEHGGRMAESKLCHVQLVAPSPLAHLVGEIPKELTVDEIEAIIASFAQAAVRAKKAGFDGVEIHGAHGYLIDQFLSRFSNKRRDGYGGNLRNRARLLIEIIKAVREAVGGSYHVWCRINGKEYGVEEGTTVNEAKEIARMAQEAGAYAIHVSAYGPKSPVNLTSPTFVPAVLEDLAREIKKAITIPVIAVGRITAEAGEMILEKGEADLIAIGKGLLADPELPSKVAIGKSEDIIPCTVCMGCLDDLFSSNVLGIQCQVNAALGREAEFEIIPVRMPRMVLVVGGGPAGMEAARAAALRGHKVTLWEKESRLGGQLIQAAIPPHKDRIRPFTEYLETQLKKLDVKVELSKEATPNIIQELKPEILVLATGVKPLVPDIPGLEQAHIVQAGDVLGGKAEVGTRVVIIGGELVGCETAEFLAEKGKKVTVMRRGPEMALRVGLTLRKFFVDRLRQKSVALVTDVRYDEVTPHGIVVTTREGERKTIEADTIVLAAGSVSDRKLYEEIKRMVPEIHLIGDCVEPRTIRDAIADGCRIGSKI